MIRAPTLCLLLATPAAAQEFVTFDTLPDDQDYYRAVACAAPPGGTCAKPFLRWPADRVGNLTVGLATVAPGLPETRRRRFERALESAVAQINALDSPLRLRRDDTDPDIAIHIVPTPPDHPIAGTGVAELDGRMLELARVALGSRGGVIQQGLIAVSALASPLEIAPVILEEVTQALGLMTDLRGPGTENSVFGEDTNAVRSLSPRDAMAVIRHYAR